LPSTQQVSFARKQKCVTRHPTRQQCTRGFGGALQEHVIHCSAIDTKTQHLPLTRLIRCLRIAREDQGHQLKWSGALDSPPFRGSAMRLLGGGLDYVCLAQIQVDHLLAKIPAHLNLNRIHKRAAAPVVVTSRKLEFLSRIPMANCEWAASHQLTAFALGNSISRQG